MVKTKFLLKTHKYCGTRNMAKDSLNKTKQDLKYHSTQAYNLGNYHQQELKPTPLDFTS